MLGLSLAGRSGFRYGGWALGPSKPKPPRPNKFRMSGFGTLLGVLQLQFDVYGQLQSNVYVSTGFLGCQQQRVWGITLLGVSDMFIWILVSFPV